MPRKGKEQKPKEINSDKLWISWNRKCNANSKSSKSARMSFSMACQFLYKISTHVSKSQSLQVQKRLTLIKSRCSRNSSWARQTVSSRATTMLSSPLKWCGRPRAIYRTYLVPTISNLSKHLKTFIISLPLHAWRKNREHMRLIKTIAPTARSSTAFKRWAFSSKTRTTQNPPKDFKICKTNHINNNKIP